MISDSRFKIKDLMDWTEIETSTHQDHVIKHVLGATVLAWSVAGDAAHFLLDMGFLWTIYSDGEMNLLPQGVAISELEGEEFTADDRTAWAAEADLLLQKGREVQGLTRFTAAPVECVIASVALFVKDDRRLITIQGDSADINIESLNDEFSISAA